MPKHEPSRTTHPSLHSIRLNSLQQSPLGVAPIGNEAGLRRQLTAGQIAMLAGGGSIGTGLLLGSGAAISIAGPAGGVRFVGCAGLRLPITLAVVGGARAQPARPAVLGSCRTS